MNARPGTRAWAGWLGRRELRSCCGGTFVLTPRGLERGLRAADWLDVSLAADAQ